MSDLRRLRPDETTEFERALLDSWQGDKPSSEARQKALMIAGGAALGASAAASTAAAAARVGASIAPKAAGLSGLSMLKWIAGGALVLGAATIAVRYAPSFASAPTPTPAESSSGDLEHAPPSPPETTQVATPAAAAEGEPIASEPVASAELQPVAPLPPPTHTEASQPKPVEKPAAPPEPAEPAPTTLPLSAHVAALDEARATLAKGDAAGALRRIEEYEQKFPRPLLGQEATVLRIEALLQQGRRDTAVALGRRFLRDHPTSSYAARVRGLIGERERASE